MKDRKLILVVVAILILGLLSFVIYKKINTPSPKIHYHAGFVVFDNGQKVDFSDSKYMTIEPCKVDTNEKPTAAEIQHDKAHLHDNIGDVVHVHVKGAVWGDLFTNIDYPIDYSKVTSFINSKQVTDIQNTQIKAYDSLVLFIGPVDKSLLSQVVTIDHIKQVESRSESCGN